MIHITDSDVSVENNVSLTGVPAARISGSRVHFTNKSGGVVSSPVVDDPNTRDSAILLEGMNSIVTNESGGVVGASHGLDLAIMGSDFAERIENHGIMHGDIELRGGADIYDGRLGSQSGTVFGGDGNDTLLGGAGNDRLEAGSGSDSVSGGGGDDLLIGGDGDDLLYGGRGADRIEGGAGIDTVDFQDIYAVYVDLLADPFGKNGFWNGARGDVLIGIENLAGTNLDDRLFGDNGQNRLVGRAGNDLVVARGGSDDLFGGAGDDILHGGLGADLIDGGDGIDVAQYSVSRDVWVDLLAGYGQWNSAAGDSLVGIENLSGSDGRDELYGDHGNNRIEGGLSDERSADLLVGRGGIDHLLGRGGNDRLDGGLGADIVDGGDGIDTAAYSGSYAVWVDLVAKTGYWNGAYDDVLISIENLSGSDNGDWLLGSFGSNRLDGGLGNDWLFAREGADHLVGGLGDDRLDGGDGRDTLDGGAGTDVVEYNGSQAIWIDLLSGHGQWSLAHGDILIGIENVIGTDGNDSLYGNGESNRLEGGSGDDLLDGRGGTDHLVGGLGDDRLGGGDGADTLDGGAGTDVVEYAGSPAVWVDLAAGTGYWNGAFNNILIDIEDVSGSSNDDRLFGNEGDNRLEGGLGNDLLTGRSGADLLVGGGGADVLLGGGGNDSFAFFSAPVIGSFDTILDFETADDMTALEESVFSGLAPGALASGAFNIGSAASEADDRIIYSSVTGALLFDADGAGGADAVQFAILANTPADLAADSFTVI